MSQSYGGFSYYALAMERPREALMRCTIARMILPTGEYRSAPFCSERILQHPDKPEVIGDLS